MDTMVRAALPVKRDTLYDVDDLNRAREVHQMKRPRVWEEDSDHAAAKTRKITQHNDLASLYMPPLRLMFQGSFHESKQSAQKQQKWLIINLQSATEFSSHTLNRDTWGNEIVAEMIASNFIFWQVYDNTTEGQKVCGYYNMMDSVPAVLVLDPFTGQKVRSWRGMVQPEALLEDLVPYMDAAPKGVYEPDKGPKHHVVRPVKIIKVYKRKARKLPSNKFGYLELTEEPKIDKELLCRISVRLPDGRRVQRNFLRTDPVQMLWSFCSSQLDAAEFPTFELKLAIPGASKTLNYEDKMTFEESGLSNSMISVTWDRS